MLNLNTSYKMPAKIQGYYLVKLFCIIFLMSLPFSLINSGWWLSALCYIFIFIGIPSFLLLLWSYHNFHFIITDNQITINSGIITKRSKSIPYNSVQNTDIVSGLLRRIFHLSTLKIWTASPAQINISYGQQRNSGDAHRPDGLLWLNNGDAIWLRDFIIKKKQAPKI